MAIPHVCIKEDRIRDMEVELAVAKSDIKNVKDDIKEVKSDMKEIKNSMRCISGKLDTRFSDLTWWLIGVLIALVGGMGYIIYSNVVGR